MGYTATEHRGLTVPSDPFLLQHFPRDNRRLTTDNREYPVDTTRSFYRAERVSSEL